MKNRRLDSQPRYDCEAEVVPGLAPFAQAELRHRFGQQILFFPQQRPETLQFRWRGHLRHLLRLRQIQSLYLWRHLPIPRPKALLGHQHFQQLLQDIETVRALHPKSAFQTFRLSAAGETSGVFTRLKSELSQHINLVSLSDEADLLIRIRPSSKLGWDVLVRLSPRPLATRLWRVQNFSGALNATLAATMVQLLHPHPDDRFLNLMCGSGTLLIERHQAMPAQLALGCDWDQPALAAAQANLTAAQAPISLLKADVRSTPLSAQQFNILCADLPWGRLVGSHHANVSLYPQFLAEATRLAAPKAKMALLTHDIKLMARVLAQYADQWQVQQQFKLTQGGSQPRLYLLRRI